MSWLKTWRERRRCFHHNNHTGESWIGNGHIVDWRKWYECSRCGKGWLI